MHFEFNFFFVDCGVSENFYVVWVEVFVFRNVIEVSDVFRVDSYEF